MDNAQQVPSPGGSHVPGRDGSHPVGASGEAHAGQPEPSWRGKACRSQAALHTRVGPAHAARSGASPGQPGLVGRKAESEACGLCGHFWGHAMANAHRSPVRRGPPAPCRPRPPPEPAPPAKGATGGWLCLHDLSSVTTWHRSGIPAQRLWSCPRPVRDPGAVGLAAAHTASQAVAHCSHPAGQGPCPEPQGVDPPRPPLPLFPNLCWLPKLPQSTARDHCQPGAGGASCSSCSARLASQGGGPETVGQPGS